MESGYIRKRNAKKRAKLLEKEAARQANIREEKRGVGQRGLSKSTQEMLAKAHGKPLAREVLENIMLKTFRGMNHWYPFDAHGSLKTRQVEFRNQDGSTGTRTEMVGDWDRFIEFAKAAGKFAADLAQYQSPKLSAISVAQPQSSKDEHVTLTVNIFDERGEKVASVIDGEAQEVQPPRRIEQHTEETEE
jgi:hypothetical protein